ELVRPEADEDDEDERRDEEEPEPERPRQRPQCGDPAALPRLAGAERTYTGTLVRDLVLGLLDLGENEIGRIRRRGAVHPPPSRGSGSCRPRGRGSPGTARPGPSRACARRRPIDGA